MTFARTPDVRYNRRFYDDFARLGSAVAPKVLATLDLLRREGPYHPSLHTRKVAGNPDDRFRFMNVDDQYRLVAVLEADVVLLEKVGNHDETLRWGSRANLDAYAERLVQTPTASRPRVGRIVAESAPLFEQSLSLPDIVARSEELSDLMSGDVYGALQGYRDGTMEDWMIFLSPLQRRAVDRAMGGPARVTGGPGTGKSVVALHRAARFAAQTDRPGSVLVTSFVRNVPEVMEGLFERLAPELLGRMRFQSIHALAHEIVTRHGQGLNLSPEAARSDFNRALKSMPARWERLQVARFDDTYLWDEVNRVVQGRGVESLGAYLSLPRHGRRRPMSAEVRTDVWGVWTDYQARTLAQTPPVSDFEGLIGRALGAVRATPIETPYHAIVVDEAQDITEQGIRLLVELLDGASNGRLLLVGDGGQRIYPGGFRLADLGLEVRGRSSSLELCYRSTDEIMKAVGAVGRFLSLDQFGEEGLGLAVVTTVRTGARPELRVFTSPAYERDWLTRELDPVDPDFDATAVLLPTNANVAAWRATLRQAGIGSVELRDYSGRPVPGVKVGTYNRAKGLEFKRVYLPGLDSLFPWGDQSNIDNVLQQGGQLYVAMSRARDRLTLSYAGQPSVLLDPVLPAVTRVV
jgi:superfamily I DNA/RNA helicase